eukprot:CAMPEP_0175137962 /NCGR_PEP_ID=MMETSP0087-20121206/10089_1 /TAXON_ID=136419 /ORGANISM="Unknown Unknown, Strain D1" /LENGTH=394 /DNA_ID=CAMNT_0016420821 /DNA_START=54 /DNA_END=1238 /DNA_ORIENTATION=+
MKVVFFAVFFFMLLGIGLSQSTHTNNWAVLVCTSRFWFNYRHIANTLSLYRAVKQMGIPDNQIILMLPDDMACSPRNPFTAHVFNNHAHEINVYPDDTEVDYRGTDVTVENFLRLLTGRQDNTIARSKRLLTDENSNILIYLSGHGGNEFIKFNDQEELSSHDLADAFHQMRKQKRYNEILFMVDTCQAATLYRQFRSPGIVSIGSSLQGENSYSHHVDNQVGLSVVDRFTYYTLDFFEKGGKRPGTTLLDLFNFYNPSKLMSNVGWNSDLFTRDLRSVAVSDFFGAVQKVIASPYSYNLSVPAGGEEASSPSASALLQQQQQQQQQQRRKRRLAGRVAAASATSAVFSLNFDMKFVAGLLSVVVAALFSYFMDAVTVSKLRTNHARKRLQQDR